MLGSPIPRPSSRSYLSRRSLSPVPAHHLPSGGSTDHMSTHGMGNYPQSSGGIVAAAGGPTTVSLPLISPAFSTSSHSDPDILKKLVGRHVINASMFSKHDLHALFNLAQTFRNSVLKDRQLDHILKVLKLVQTE